MAGQHASTVVIFVTKIILRVGVPLKSGQTNERNPFHHILWGTIAPKIHVSEPILCCSTLISRKPVQFQRRGIIASEVSGISLLKRPSSCRNRRPERQHNCYDESRGALHR